MSEQAGASNQRLWHVMTVKRRYGPYPQQELLAWIRRGVFPPDARFSCGGNWMSAAEAVNLINANQHDKPVLLEVVTEAPPPAAVPYPTAVPEAPTPSVPFGAAGPSPPAAGVPTVPAQAPSAAPEANATVPRRDRIVVIGRRASGKTIYLASLYKHLWKSRDGMTMKALSGQVHKELMSICETLRRGEWPAATLPSTLSHMEVEVTYKGHTETLVGLDYAGEVFSKAFVNDDAESPEAKALLSHIDRAAAVILLVDPAIAVSGDSEAFVDDDFGIVQAIRRIRDWPGGEKVPIALVLTKADQNLRLFKGKENTKEFIATHYPALVRTLGRCKYFHASAVQSKRDREGRLRPSPDSVPVNIVEPLKYCLAVLQQYEEQERLAAEQEAKQQAVQDYVHAQEAAQRHDQRVLALWIIGIITLGAGILFMILVFRM